jgi:hypothetical protein
MSHPERRRGKNIVVNIPTPIVDSWDILVIETDYHNGVSHYPQYDEIYRIFNTRDFPPKDENLEFYKNILKKLHSPHSCSPYVFSLCDTTIWFLSHFDKETTSITRK